ncbi:ABC transporter permease [Burkholderia gladioli pv. gladioli]|uniref:ABC transporter permease n=1 Tax=Burkholderia gladioli TaxID=28095 RepID=A0A095G085_BURGA|nr:ABC transporter permease [Burkholderia gladioli]AJW98661.1 binding--dependent transport system inner membrane component family protein [Burkholderia gladioli]ASD79856.1 ABC transporter permease [Burkholderia gladioli pv. gladioli]AWY56904.1 ABC transporter permease [Burkholderia gladioli pv. gladioli]KGC10817.1 binding--dependent transport system inner membrane component family protein [Burkholderia gladioli]MDJ1164115.1 ABC transporter permease [Burkholderia gladioli pv. gladioli]
MIHWLLDGSHWSGSDGIVALIFQHLTYTGEALFAASLVGLPLGLYVGHTRRGVFVIAGLANAMRALPSLGLIVLLVIVFGPVFESDLAFEVPSLIVLAVLAMPPIVTATYAGILAVDPAVVDAARGMGYRPLRLLLSVEVPCGLPMIVSGLRSATLQTISTATIAAYVSLGGLGRLIIDGRAQNDYLQMAAGAILVGALALSADLLMGALSQLLVSPGITRRRSRCFGRPASE